MAYSLPLSPELTQARWKVKIFDKENREPPHVTIVRGRDKWRINLRTMSFMDERPTPRKVVSEVIQAIRENWNLFCAEWDEIHPENPVERTDNEDD
jgi:hypothetical protein